MSDNGLIDLAAKVIEEHEAWLSRNAARKALREWRRNYQDETGEYFDRDTSEENEEMEDVQKFDELRGAARRAQSVLAKKRAATRRAITRAAAIGRGMVG
jgi:hypothetical protein